MNQVRGFFSSIWTENAVIFLKKLIWTSKNGSNRTICFPEKSLQTYKNRSKRAIWSPPKKYTFNFLRKGLSGQPGIPAQAPFRKKWVRGKGRGKIAHTHQHLHYQQGGQSYIENQDTSQLDLLLTYPTYKTVKRNVHRQDNPLERDSILIG